MSVHCNVCPPPPRGIPKTNKQSQGRIPCDKLRRPQETSPRPGVHSLVMHTALCFVFCIYCANASLLLVGLIVQVRTTTLRQVTTFHIYIRPSCTECCGQAVA